MPRTLNSGPLILSPLLTLLRIDAMLCWTRQTSRADLKTRGPPSALVAGSLQHVHSFLHNVEPLRWHRCL